MDSYVFSIVNSSLNGINVYVGDDKKLHFVDSAGADTVIPFNKSTEVAFLNASSSSCYALLKNEDGTAKTLTSNATISGDNLSITRNSNLSITIKALVSGNISITSFPLTGDFPPSTNEISVSEGQIICTLSGTGALIIWK